ncbi:MAG: cysteine desulfurase family protein [Bacteriovoracaceae bacterium]|jgi:cysteine desulfurase|nr:cysteine desulfurase family protein [Bacteriovoracaceae bacterium]
MIYADYNGSAPLCDDVREYLVKRINEGPYSNPNAIHSLGKKMMFGMEKCRRTLAKHLNCQTHQIIFNSGASEGIAQIFFSLLDERPSEKNIIITSGIEHSAVVQCCQRYQNKGYQIEYINTLDNGVIDLQHYQELIKKFSNQIALITSMAANNETGVIQPYQEIGKIAQENKVPFFCDTTQFIGKTEFNFDQSNIDYAVCSSHKIGALIGAGFIIAKDPTRLKPLILGGGQEKGLRGGTQNYIGIETMAVAMESFYNNKEKLNQVNESRLAFEQKIKEKFPEVAIMGDGAPRLATTTMIAYPGIHGQAVQIELESQNIFVTTSSACSDNKPETSRVLKAMKINDDIGRGVIRISFCLNANQELYDKIEDALTNAYNKLKKIQSY